MSYENKTAPMSKEHEEALKKLLEKCVPAEKITSMPWWQKVEQEDPCNSCENKGKVCHCTLGGMKTTC